MSKYEDDLPDADELPTAVAVESKRDIIDADVVESMGEFTEAAVATPAVDHTLAEKPAPTVKVAEVSEEEEDARSVTDYEIEAKSVPYTETRKCVTEPEVKAAHALTAGLLTYSQPPVITYTLASMAKTDVDEEAANMFNPYFIFSQEVLAKGEWVQSLKHNESTVGPRAPRLRSTGGELHGHAALVRLRRVTGGGNELTYELPHTGIVITMTPPKETRMVDLDLTISTMAVQAGLQTNGLLMSARSGIFSRKLVEFALEHVISTNLMVEDGSDMVTTLRKVIDPRDYAMLIWGLQATKTPNGHPWVFKCSNPDCGHEHEASLHFARTYWLDRSRLTEKQLDILTRTTKGVTLQDLKVYKEEFPKSEYAKITLDSGIIIELEFPTMDEYLASADKWCQEIETQYNQAMRNHTTEARRSEFLRSVTQSRRMQRYSHLVKAIHLPVDDIISDEPIFDIVNNDTEEGRQTIVNLLVELSSTTTDFSLFENSIMEFIENNTVCVIAHSEVDCPTCNFVPKNSEGHLRSLVPLPIDRVFFTLLQQKVLALSTVPTL